MSKTPENICNRCGGPRTAWGCRSVPLGEYCVVTGLAEDPSRVRPGPEADPRIEQNPEVRAAAAVWAAAVRREVEATARWEEAALARYQTKGRRLAGQQLISVGGMLTEIVPPGTSNADLARLRDTEENTDQARREAGAQVVQARQLLDDTRTRIRRKLASRSVA